MASIGGFPKLGVPFVEYLGVYIGFPLFRETTNCGGLFSAYSVALLVGGFSYGGLGA